MKVQLPGECDRRHLVVVCNLEYTKKCDRIGKSYLNLKLENWYSQGGPPLGHVTMNLTFDTLNTLVSTFYLPPYEEWGLIMVYRVTTKYEQNMLLWLWSSECIGFFLSFCPSSGFRLTRLVTFWVTKTVNKIWHFDLDLWTPKSIGVFLFWSSICVWSL